MEGEAVLMKICQVIFELVDGTPEQGCHDLFRVQGLDVSIPRPHALPRSRANGPELPHRARGSWPCCVLAAAGPVLIPPAGCARMMPGDGQAPSVPLVWEGERDGHGAV